MVVAAVLHGGEQRNGSVVCEVAELCAAKPWWRMARR